MQVPAHTFDGSRLDVLDSSAALETPADAAFDDIVELVTLVCDVPAALVSLVAGDHRWFKARIGFEARERDLNDLVCVHALEESDLLVIPDPASDERTRSNPLVTGAPHVRFYAGTPLRTTAGEVLGALCAIDVEPRPGGLTASQAAGLKALARQVMSQLALRRAVGERDVLLAGQRRAEERRNGLLFLGDRLRDVGSVGDMTRAAAAIVGETLGVDRAGFGRLVENDDVIVVESDWTADGLASVAGRHRLADYGDLHEELLRGEPLVIEDVLTDPRTVTRSARLLTLGVRSLVHMPVRERGRTVAVFLVHDRQPRAWAAEVLTFLRNVADRVEVGVARLKAEAHQHVLNRELSHRMKNTFAMVQAIASQTLRSVPDQEPVEAFTRRLHTLSTAHDLLLQQSWATARIAAVMQAVLNTLVEPRRIEIAGPQLELGPRATLSLSLLLHELATNALKHGALSREGGRILIGWQVTSPEKDAELVLSWHEFGGPPAEPPKRKGFGSRLIRLGLIGTGGMAARYLPSGLQIEFKAPLAQVQAS